MFREFLIAASHATIELPAIELIVLIGLLATCLVFRFTRVGLLAAYALTYRWGWKYMQSQNADTFMTYVALGIVVGALAVISMLKSAGRD